MKFGEYVEKLNKFLKDNPKTASYETVKFVGYFEEPDDDGIDVEAYATVFNAFPRIGWCSEEGIFVQQEDVGKDYIIAANAVYVEYL